ncbi:hypothetical protein EVAR_58109_1 [Eumeta japonica]|uniref:Uncharacterized protein n=1 Tax=Eumeta variegata TaxID=151549 RepID=A0A4C1YNK9_EUMVA|nr:hypothetical protein EVAR_58109_1 [Eumeta japonica]
MFMKYSFIEILEITLFQENEVGILNKNVPFFIANGARTNSDVLYATKVREVGASARDRQREPEGLPLTPPSEQDRLSAPYARSFAGRASTLYGDRRRRDHEL